MNVVVYARFSSHNQTEQSIEGQLKECCEFAERNGYTVVKEYIDRAISGTTDNRPQFLQMIADSASKGFDAVLVYQLDRFARNRFDSAIYKASLKKNGVRVLSARENITEDASGVLIEGLLESMAEYYSVELSQKIKRGMGISATKGQYTGGGIALGYKIVNKRFTLDDTTAPVVKEIFELYASGTTAKEICDSLNARQVATSVGNKFNKNSLHRILCNKKYIGIYTYNGEEMLGVVPRIVSDELFEQVQQKLGVNKQAPAHSKAKEEYILTTKLFCGKCHAMMTGIKGNSHTGRVYNYYKCNNAKEKMCDKKTVQKQYIEDIVTSECSKLLTKDSINRIATEAYAICELENDDFRLKDIQKKLKDNEKQKNNLLSTLRLCEADSVRQTICEELGRVEQEKTALEKALAKEKISSTQFSKDDIKHFLEKLQRGNFDDIKYRKMLVNIFVNKIFLYDDKMAIFFNTSEKPVDIDLKMLAKAEEDGFVFEPACSTKRKDTRQGVFSFGGASGICFHLTKQGNRHICLIGQISQTIQTNSIFCFSFKLRCDKIFFIREGKLYDKDDLTKQRPVGHVIPPADFYETKHIAPEAADATE